MNHAWSVLINPAGPSLTYTENSSVLQITTTSFFQQNVLYCKVTLDRSVCSVHLKCLSQGFLDFITSWLHLQQQQQTFKDACKWKYKMCNWDRIQDVAPACSTYRFTPWAHGAPLTPSHAPRLLSVTSVARLMRRDKRSESLPVLRLSCVQQTSSSSAASPTLCLSVRPGGGLRVEAGELSTVLNPRRRRKKKKKKKKRRRRRRRADPPPERGPRMVLTMNRQRGAVSQTPAGRCAAETRSGQKSRMPSWPHSVT